MIECKICQKEFLNNNSLSKHLLSKKCCNSIKEYYDMFLKKEDEGICYCGKNTNFTGIGGYCKYCSRKCSTNSIEVQNEKKNTCLEKYGKEYISQTDMYHRKYKETCLEKFGTEHPLQSKTIQENRKSTQLLKYGYQHILQNPEFMKKKQQTMINRYGVLSVPRTKEIQEKIEKTCFYRYGFKSSNSSPVVKDKIKKTCLIRYQVETISQAPEIKRKLRISAIKRIEKQKSNGESLIPCAGNHEKEFLDELQKYTEYKIIRNDRSFRYMIGRFPDGHIREIKLFIQLDERHHFNDYECKQYKSEDIQCTKDLESIDGYRVFRVSEKSWLESKDTVVENFKSYLQPQCLLIAH